MKIASAILKGLFNIILVIFLFMRAFSTKHKSFLYACQMFFTEFSLKDRKVTGCTCPALI